MIIKELTRKGNQGQLFRYLFRYMKDQKKLDDNHVVVTHNVFGKTVNEYIQSFKENEKLRIHKRKNNVKIRHSILSFSHKDSVHITKEVLENTARKFIELRGKDNLFVMVSHHDQDHIHIHACVSATNIFGMSSRMSFQGFNDLKQELSAYIKQEFPNIKHSFPEHGRKRKERQIEKIKSKRLSQKETLQQCVDTIFTTSKSTEHFLEQIKEQGHEPYYRNGRLQGILHDGETKHRFSALGYDNEKLGELEYKDVLQEIDDIRNQEDERDYNIDTLELDELRDSRDDEYEQEPEYAHTSVDSDDEE